MSRAGRFGWRPPGIGISEPARRFVAIVALLLAIVFAGESGAAEGGRKGANANDSIRLTPIQVPIIVKQQVVGQAGVLVQLDLANPGDFDTIEKQRPHLLDAFLTELYGVFDQLQNAPTIIDPAIVKEHLMRVADRILGAGKIREIEILRTYEKRNRS